MEHEEVSKNLLDLEFQRRLTRGRFALGTSITITLFILNYGGNNFTSQKLLLSYIIVLPSAFLYINERIAMEGIKNDIRGLSKS